MKVYTEEDIETIRRMHAEGASGSGIAAELGVSRNAILGKLHRLGLKDADRPLKLRNGNAAGRYTRERLGLPTRRRKPSAPRTIKVAPHKGFKRSTEKVSRKPKPVPAAIVPVLGPVRFVDRPDRERCVWIDGDVKAGPIGDLMCCGEAVKPGTNWCPHHYARLHDRYVMSEESATFVPRAA